jgi:hypothetical protein
MTQQNVLTSLHYPHSNRRAGVVVGNLAIDTSERVSDNLAQEFVFGKFASERRAHELAAHPDATHFLPFRPGSQGPGSSLF